MVQRPAEGGPGQGVGSKVVQGRAVRGRRVQGWGSRAGVTGFKKTWPQEQKSPEQHLVWPYKAYGKRLKNVASDNKIGLNKKTFGLA